MLEECQFVRYSARGWLMADYADRFTLDKTGIAVSQLTSLNACTIDR